MEEFLEGVSELRHLRGTSVLSRLTTGSVQTHFAAAAAAEKAAAAAADAAAVILWLQRRL